MPINFCRELFKVFFSLFLRQLVGKIVADFVENASEEIMDIFKTFKDELGEYYQMFFPKN